jgi:hypothetical protein
MFLFPHRLHPAAARGRAYSSFFSNKAGGGRYFNSAKPPKSVVSPAANKGKIDAPSSSADAPDGINSTSNSNSSNGGDHHQMKASDQTTSVSSTGHAKSSRDTLASSPHTSTSAPSPLPHVHPQHSTLLHHPSVDSKDFKLHQFFSLHRPLLLLSHPTSTIFEQTPYLPPSNPLSLLSAGTADAPPANLGTLDNPPEASAEADADAARQLARALMMNRVGGTIAWEATLRHLGLDVSLEEGRVSTREQCEKEWEEIVMDSTKRKRRSKMKKHK